jgi:hypothetical protein
MLAAQPTLVVRISNTSHDGEAGSNSAFDARALRGCHRRNNGQATIPKSRYRLFPSAPINGRCESIGLAVVKMPVTSW